MLEIINQKNMNFLFEIAKKPRNISELAKRGDMAISNVSTLISRWARENVVKKTNAEGERGREITITLTEYGEKQIKLLKQIAKNYKENKLLTFEEAKALSLVSEHENQEFYTNTEKGGEK